MASQEPGRASQTRWATSQCVSSSLSGAAGMSLSKEERTAPDGKKSPRRKSTGALLFSGKKTRKPYLDNQSVTSSIWFETSS